MIIRMDTHNLTHKTSVQELFSDVELPKDGGKALFCVEKKTPDASKFHRKEEITVRKQSRPGLPR